MKPEEFNRLRDIVLDVVKVTGDRRVEILEQRCSSDEELRAALKLLEFDTGPDGLGSALHLAGSVPEAGENLGRYRVVRQIGVGGMGVVLAALDPSLDREVAVKVLPDWMAENPGAHRRFRQEARLLARLNHSNIATVYSLEQEQHYVFLTMELVPGRSLSDLLRSGAMSVDTALSLARQLASAVEAAHDQGVIHRDLKPSNVMVTDSGVVKVLDFGIAKLTGQLDNGGSDSDEADPSTGAMGTPGYMSPEQIHGGPTDHRTDVWSFGCVLFDCLAGRPAFGGETRRARLEATLRKDPDLDLLAEETPPPVRTLITNCLRKDIGDRLASIRMARQSIDSVVEARTTDRLRARLASSAPSGATNLPRFTTRFLGREDDVTALEGLVQEKRLVTVTGVGGCGKTRIATHVAERLLALRPGGVWFVDLAAIRDPSGVLQALMTALGLKEQPSRPPIDTLIAKLSGGEATLLLDNCEHLVDACRPLVDELVKRCRVLQVLVTSRVRLDIDGECVYALPPMQVPQPDDVSWSRARLNDAVQLFVDRAGAVDARFELTDANAAPVAGVCRYLEGLPLAIELAASRVRALSLDEILEQVQQDRFRFLKRGSAAPTLRHESLRRVLDWSYQQLSPGAQTLFRRLAVFRDSWTHEAVEAVCAGDGVPQWHVLEWSGVLIEHSLVQRDMSDRAEHGPPRYRMLETVREYAEERLAESDDARETLRRHVLYYFDLVKRFRNENRRMFADEDNIRSALSRFGEAEVPVEEAASAAGHMGVFWFHTGRWEEGIRRYQDLAAEMKRSGKTDGLMYGRTLRGHGALLATRGQQDQARPLLQEGMRVGRSLGHPGLISECLSVLGVIESRDCNFSEARKHFQDIRGFPVDSQPLAHFQAVYNIALIDTLQGRYGDAVSAFQKCVALSDAFGGMSMMLRMLALSGVAAVRGLRGEIEESRRLHEECLSACRDISDLPGQATALRGLGMASLLTFDPSLANHDVLVRARQRYQEALELMQRCGDTLNVGRCLQNLAETDLVEGRLGEARSGADAVAGEVELASDYLLQAMVSTTAGLIDVREERFDDAWRRGREAARFARRVQLPAVLADALDVLALAGRGMDDPAAAAMYLAAADRMRREVGLAVPLWKKRWLAEELDVLRTCLSEVELKSATERGRSTPLDDLPLGAD